LHDFVSEENDETWKPKKRREGRSDRVDATREEGNGNGPIRARPPTPTAMKIPSEVDVVDAVTMVPAEAAADAEFDAEAADEVAEAEAEAASLKSR